MLSRPAKSSGISHLILQDLCVQQAKHSSSETLLKRSAPFISSHLPTFYLLTFPTSIFPPSAFRLPTSNPSHLLILSPSHLLLFLPSAFASSEFVEGRLPTSNPSHLLSVIHLQSFTLSYRPHAMLFPQAKRSSSETLIKRSAHFTSSHLPTSIFPPLPRLSLSKAAFRLPNSIPLPVNFASLGNYCL
jgi:hypothetical protein